MVRLLGVLARPWGRIPLLAGVALAMLAGSRGASALSSSALDIEDPVVINTAPATDLTLATTGDVFVFVPNGLFTDNAVLNGGTAVIIEADTVVGQNNPLLCEFGCLLDSFDLDQDVVLNILDPIGNLSVQTPGSILVTPRPIPEPSTAPLVGAGLAVLAGGCRPGGRCAGNRAVLGRGPSR